MKEILNNLGFVGSENTLTRISAAIKSAAQSPFPVLITGETGTGKELIAQAIFNNSEKNNFCYHIVNCGALVDSLKESELFGYEKGAFTGALSTKVGLFETATGGTLFLDEIGEMALNQQPMLLRALETNLIKRVGSNKYIPVDVRIIAATNRDLSAEAMTGKFREDLFYRLSMIDINLPPLRERKEDILLIAHHFYERFSQLHHVNNPPKLSINLLNYLYNHTFRGNVRELRNMMIQFVLQRKNPMDKLIQTPITYPTNRSFCPMVNSFEYHKAEIIKMYLDRNNWNKQKTAAELGIAKSTLFKFLKKFNLKPENVSEN